MEIHELNTFSGTLGSSDFFATDNGNDTSKVSAAAIIDPLNARIDNIIAGPASSAQEVIDARLGANGVTYSSLGDAIRTQVTDAKSDKEDLIGRMVETNISSIYHAGYLWNVTTRAEVAQSLMGYIAITDIDFARFKVRGTNAGNTTDYPFIAFYDSNNSIIKRINTQNLSDTPEYTVPSSTAKIIINDASNAPKLWLLDKADVVEELDSIYEMIETDAKLSVKHKALVIQDVTDASYGNPSVLQLTKNGFTVEYISPECFVREFDTLDHDILLMGGEIVLKHYSPVTAKSVRDKIEAWINKGKQIIFLVQSTRFGIYKPNANNVEAVSSLAELLIVNIGNYTIASGSTEKFYSHSQNPFGSAILDNSYLPHNFIFGAYWSSSASEFRKTVIQTNQHYYSCVVNEPNKWTIVCWGGSSATDEMSEVTGFRYVDVGLIARKMLKDSSDVGLAFDCFNNQKIVASGIDGDVTNDPEATLNYYECYNGRLFEYGLWANKVTDELADQYHGINGMRIVSHSTNHTTVRVTENETYTIPTAQFVRIKHPYVARDFSVVDSNENTFTRVYSLSGIGTGKYYVDEYGVVTFYYTDFGKTVTITYNHICDYEEWLGSLPILQNKKCLAKDVIYDTHSPYAVHPNSFDRMRNNNITLCHYEGYPSNATHRYLSQSLTIGRMHPIFGCAPFAKGLGYAGGVDALFLSPEADAKNVQFPAMIETANYYNQPYAWYSHDFLLSETYMYSLWVDSDNRWGSGWKKSTYAETLANAKDMIKWMFEQLDSLGCYWMTRSDYAERFEQLNEGIIYNVVSASKIVIKNIGDKAISGLTFRTSNTSITEIKSEKGDSIPFNVFDSELRFSLDISAGETQALNFK